MRFVSLLVSAAISVLVSACGSGSTSADDDVPPDGRGADASSADGSARATEEDAGRAGPDAARIDDAATPDGSAACASGATVIMLGQALTLSSPSGGSAKREYCVAVPAASVGTILLKIEGGTGGTCTITGVCSEDLSTFLKQGAQPDPLAPDAATVKSKYTPLPTAVSGVSRPVVGGPWYLTVVDDPRTGGYQSVRVSVSLSN